METINYKGHLITIKQSEFPLRPDEFFEDGFILSNYRHFYIEHNKVIAEYVKNNYADYEKHHHIFPLSLHDHSGIVLHIGEFVGWDISMVGYILIDKDIVKSDAKALKKATELLELWNMYLIGDVYDINCGSCEYDTNSVYGDNEVKKVIKEIKSIIDSNFDSIKPTESQINNIVENINKYSAYYDEINNKLIKINSNIKLCIK